MFRAVTRQLKLARDITASVAAIARTVAGVLDPRLSSFLEEGAALDGLGTVQIALVRWIDDDHQQLETLEGQHRAALRKLKQLRIRREAEQSVFYGQMLQVRNTFEDAHGPGTAAVYLGLDPGMGDVEPLVLRRYGRETIGVLSAPDLLTPEPTVVGLWENPQRFAEQILASLEPFEATLAAVEAQKMEVEMALRAKTDLLEVLRDRLKWSVRFFEALYYLAGQGFHAERLRPPKPSRSTEPATDGEAEPATDGESEDTAADTAAETVEAVPPEPPTAQESPAASA